MKYCSSSEIAEKWNMSDRRVRTLAASGRIPGAKKEGKSYLIPELSEKPADRRFREESRVHKYGASILFYLKWADEVVGEIDQDLELEFLNTSNPTVKLYSADEVYWDRAKVLSFLEGRVISSSRRDIEHLLNRLGLNTYDVLSIAEKTKAINASDLFWITKEKEEKFEDAVSEVFSSVFIDRVDLTGDSVDSPEGMNIKRYGVYNGKYGIYKKRINPLSMDIEAELAVAALGKALGVPCCNVYRIDKDTIFSEFAYDFPKEYIVHFRRIVPSIRSDNEYQNLISVRPGYQRDIIKMIALDFITRQDDRHLSNVAVKIGKDGESFYPLYDNGRSLFFEDTKETADKAPLDIKGFATSFGPSGSYYDYITEIAETGVDFSRLLNLKIKEKEIEKILKDVGFTDYRLDAAKAWITNTIKFLREL